MRIGIVNSHYEQICPIFLSLLFWSFFLLLHQLALEILDFTYCEGNVLITFELAAKWANDLSRASLYSFPFHKSTVNVRDSCDKDKKTSHRMRSFQLESWLYGSCEGEQKNLFQTKKLFTGHLHVTSPDSFEQCFRSKFFICVTNVEKENLIVKEEKTYQNAAVRRNTKPSWRHTSLDGSSLERKKTRTNKYLLYTLR